MDYHVRIYTDKHEGIMKLKVSKWGNSLAVRIPAEYARQVGIEEGDSLEAEVSPTGELLLFPGASPEAADQAWAEADALATTLPATASVVEQMRREARY